MSLHNEAATKRLESAAKGVQLTDDKLDPALRIPKSSRLDAWENQTTGFGKSSQHPVTNTSYVDLGKLSSDQLEGLYRSDWVSRKMIDAPAEDMTRNGISYKHNDDDSDDDAETKKKNAEAQQKKVEDFDNILVQDFNWWQKSFEALALAGMSGGSLTVFAFDDIQTPEDFKLPLNENQVSEIHWTRTVPAHLAIPLSFYRDINHPKWGQPEHYQVIIREPNFGITLEVHESRVIRVNGRFTTQQNRVTNRGWHDSDLQAVYTAIREYGTCVTSSSSTLQSFTQDYLGMKGLASMVMNNETDIILERVFLAHLKMTSNTLSLYDAESEQMERKGTPITGLATLWDRYSEAICGASGIPRSRFFSSVSGALGGNAAESDTRNYFNRIKSRQEITLRAYLNQFMEFVNLAVNMLDSIPDYDFNNLAEQSDKEIAETEYTVAQKDEIYMNQQVIAPIEVAKSRFSKSKTDLTTNNVDFQAREEMEDEATPEEVEEMRNTIENMETEKAINEAAAKQNLEKQQTEIPEKPEEKKDSQPIVIEHKPQITVESPTINVEIPEQKDNSEDIKKDLAEIKDKLNEDIDV